MLTVVLFLWGAGFELALLNDWSMIGWFTLLSVIAAGLGYFLSIFPGVIFMGPHLYGRTLINGAPFEVGDRVQIIGGEFDGTQAEVLESYDRGVVVALGDEADEKHKNVFDPIEVFRVTDA